MIGIVPHDAAERYPAFFYAFHSLRQKVFVEKTRWSDLACDDGRAPDPSAQGFSGSPVERRKQRSGVAGLEPVGSGRCFLETKATP